MVKWAWRFGFAQRITEVAIDSSLACFGLVYYFDSRFVVQCCRIMVLQLGFGSANWSWCSFLLFSYRSNDWYA